MKGCWMLENEAAVVVVIVLYPTPSSYLDRDKNGFHAAFLRFGCAEETSQGGSGLRICDRVVELRAECPLIIPPLARVPRSSLLASPDGEYGSAK